VARVRIGSNPQFSYGESRPTRDDPYYIQTEFQVIESEIILKPVVEKLILNTEWGKKYSAGTPFKTSESIHLLKSRMDLRPVANTSLVDIGVYSEDREEAAQIANTIAETYRLHRFEEARDIARAGTRVLEERFEEQEAKIRQAQSNVNWLRVMLAIPDSEANESAQGLSSSADTLRRMEGTRIESRAEYDRQNNLLTRLKSLRDHVVKARRGGQAYDTFEAIVGDFPADRQGILPALTRHLTGEVAKIAAAMPHDRIALQWDVCQEVLAWEGYYDKGPVDFRTETLDVLETIGDAVPAAIELGYHLCYGSPADEHLVQPKDTGVMVEMTNAIVDRVKRPIQFFHMPVPKGRLDDAYFAPLEKLKPHPQTELYLGLIHHDDAAGDAARLAAARRHARVDGVSTECGMARGDPTRLSAMLAAHVRAAEIAT
jgi:hypothetical protein